MVSKCEMGTSVRKDHNQQAIWLGKGSLKKVCNFPLEEYQYEILRSPVDSSNITTSFVIRIHHNKQTLCSYILDFPHADNYRKKSLFSVLIL